MSIIHRALKRAESQKAKEKKVHIRIFSVEGRRLWGTVLAGLAVLTLAVFFVIYFVGGDKLPGRKPERPVTVGLIQTPAPVLPAKPDASALLKEALKNIGEGKYPEALRLLRQAISIEPDNPSLHNHLGLALKRSSNLKGAISAYDNALRLKPDYYVAMNNLAVALEAGGRKKRAEELYKRALSVNPFYPEAHLNYGLLLESTGRVAEATTHFETFLNLSTDEELKGLLRKRQR